MSIEIKDTLSYSGTGKQIIDGFFNGTPIYFKIGRSYGAKSRYNGSIGVLRKIILKDGPSQPKANNVNDVKMHLASKAYGKKLVFQLGFDGETKTINLDPWELRSATWEDTYTGPTILQDNHAALQRRAEAVKNDAKDVFDNELAIGDPVVYYYHATDRCGVGTIKNIKVKTKYGRIVQPHVEVQDTFTGQIVNILQYNRLILLTDALKSDVLLKKLAMD
jgi:hypothetical protein